MYIFLSFSLYISSLEVIINGEISRKRLNTQSLTCDVCEELSSINQNCSEEFKRINSGENLYVCDVFEKSFGRKYVLTHVGT